MEIGEFFDKLGPHTSVAEAETFLSRTDTAEAHVLRLLRQRDLAPSVIEAVARHDRWRDRRVIRNGVVHHPKAPRTLTLRLLNFLFWRELLKVTANYRLPMPLRVAAEARLRDQLPSLETGEKISLARSAPEGLLPLLANAPDPRLIRALLANPRLKETEVVGIARREATPPPVLRVLATNERWSIRPSVRLAVVQHRNTPIHVALTLLSQCPPQVLRDLIMKNALPRVVAIRAERLLSGADSRDRWGSR